MIVGLGLPLSAHRSVMPSENNQDDRETGLRRQANDRLSEDARSRLMGGA